VHNYGSRDVRCFIRGLRCRIRDSRLVEHVEGYIRLCAMNSGQEPAPPRYLRLIPYALPLKQLIVGQSPYDPRVLPRYSAAFAFNY
jgi:hypothetical protein